jgi:hypothetical protein
MSVVNWFLEKLPDPDIAFTDEYQAPMGDQEFTLQNVAVVLEGTSKETILIAAPRDTPSVVKVEPLSYASGTAILLELIQVFYARPHQKTLVFLSTEDGTTGGLGINDFLDTSSLAENVVHHSIYPGIGQRAHDFSKGSVTDFRAPPPVGTCNS